MVDLTLNFNSNVSFDCNLLLDVMGYLCFL